MDAFYVSSRGPDSGAIWAIERDDLELIALEQVHLPACVLGHREDSR